MELLMCERCGQRFSRRYGYAARGRGTFCSRNCSAQNRRGTAFPPVFLPAQLREARHQVKLSQSQVARKLGTTTETIRRWEHGEIVPSGPAMLGLCVLYRLSPTALLLSRQEQERMKTNDENQHESI